MINEYGDVYPCIILENSEFKLGNILTSNLNDIFDSEKYNNFIDNKLLKCVVDTIPRCKDFNVKYFCMNDCLGITISNFNNKKIRDERCTEMYPYLEKILWSN